MKNQIKAIGLTIGIVLALGILILGVNALDTSDKNNDAEEKKIYAAEEKPMKVGETVQISGLKVTLNSLVDDYRCGTDPSCPEYGAVVANVTLSNGEIKTTRNLPSDEVPHGFSGYKTSIIKVTPEKIDNKQIVQSEYIVTFRVEQITH